MNFFKHIFRNFPDVDQNKFTLAFKDADLESSFFHFYTEQYLIHGRICHVLAAVFYSFYGIFDATLFPDSKYTMWFIRFAVVLPVFILGFLYSYSNSYKKNWQLLFWGYVVITGSGYVYMTAITPLSLNYSLYTGIIFCLFFGYAFIRLRVVFSSLAGWLLTIGYTVVVILRYDAPNTIVMNNLPHIVGINFLGMFIGYSMELAARHNFLLIKDLAKIEKELRNSHKLLEDRVKERTEELEKVNLALVEDRKERLKVEEQFRQAQKMEAIGTLAGGVAHDFNNILSAILGYSELALADVKLEAPLRNKLEAIHSSGLRARDLVAQILAFSRKDEQVRIPVELHLIIEDALKLLRPAIPTSIDIQTQIISKCTIIGDPSRIHQIIMNLCTNAYQAMLETGGILGISLSQAVIEGEAAVFARVPAGLYGKIIISDTGVGIPPAIVKRIFEPYFTTKEKGKGTGLGLAAVHGIVKSHNGSILVESQIGKGTRFEVNLPLTLDRIVKDEIVEIQLRGGNERILLIDDERDILKIQKEMLKSLGYIITSVDNAREALALVAKDQEQFDLIITDMTMPNMTGDKLAVELQKIHSEIPIILCTGFSELISKEKAESIGIKGFLLKPIGMKDLANMIRNVLDNTPDRTSIIV